MPAPRILVTVVNYGTNNDRYMHRVLAEYRAMPFAIDVVVLSNLDKTLPDRVELRRVNLKGQDPWSLPFAHKAVMAEKVDAYDLFIYTEDDILITEKNIRAFLDLSSIVPEHQLTGFFRFEEGVDGARSYPDVHSHFHWDPQSVCREPNGIVLAHFTNVHSACYALTQPQLKRCIHSGGFLVDPHQGTYDLMVTAATDPYTQCGFDKILCISRFDDFLVHHLSNRYVGSTFGIKDKDFQIQLSTLQTLAEAGLQQPPLLNTQSKLWEGQYSKDYYEPARTEILSLVPPTARTALSLGCGSGAMESNLAEQGLQVTAVPLDAVMAGGLSHRQIEVISGTLATVLKKLRGRQFDCIYSLNMLQLIPEPLKLLNSIESLLAPRGSLILCVPNMSCLPVYWHRLRGNKKFAGLHDFVRSGVRSISYWKARKWIIQSGMTLTGTVHLHSQRTATLSRLTRGSVDALFSREFIVTAAANKRAPRYASKENTMSEQSYEYTSAI